MLCVNVLIHLVTCLSAAHSPDNSFMGFVVDQMFNHSEDITKENIALVYGKNDYMWHVSGEIFVIIVLISKDLQIVFLW